MKTTVSKGMLVSVLASVCLMTVSKTGFCAETIITSYLSRSYLFVPAYIAVSKGFFKDQGLETLMVQMKAQASTAALTSGHTQYAFAGPSTLNAIIQGAPVRLVGVIVEKTFHFIVARKEIRTASDLRGKKLGTARLGGPDHLVAEGILQSKGINIKDVQFVTVGGADEPVRVEILKKGLVDAIVVSLPFPLLLKKEGYQILGGPGDTKLGIISAIGTTEQRLNEKREEVKKVLRAIVRGIRFFHEQREETISIMMAWLSQSREIAAESYDMARSYYSPDGATSDSNLQFNIDTVKGLIGSTEPIQLSKVTDFTILREVQKEFGLR